LNSAVYSCFGTFFTSLPSSLDANHRPLEDEKRRAAHKSLQWDDLSRCLHADIVPTPDLSAIVELLLGGRRMPMSRSPESAGHWTCALIDGLDAATVFASLIVTIGADTWEADPRWVDDVASLEHASQAARLLEPIRGLDRNGSSTEQRQMLDELQEVAQILFNDTSSFRDPNFGGISRKTKGDAPSALVNPNDLIVHLEESHHSLPHLGSARPGSLSLTGILRLLFEAETDDGSKPAAAGDENIDEGQIPDGPAKPKKTNKKEHPEEGVEGPPIEARSRERLAAQINTFLTAMSTAKFSERCTATQMVQAISFPLAVALRGQRRGWVTAELAEKWALEIFSILFRSRGATAGGLLSIVEQRYVQNGKKDTFDDVVGDGTLWLVLVATLGGANWRGVGTEIDKAVALREVFAAPQLLASAQLTCPHHKTTRQGPNRGRKVVRRACCADRESAPLRNRKHVATGVGVGDAKPGRARHHPQAGRSALARECGMGRLPGRNADARRSQSVDRGPASWGREECGGGLLRQCVGGLTPGSFTCAPPRKSAANGYRYADL